MGPDCTEFFLFCFVGDFFFFLVVCFFKSSCHLAGFHFCFTGPVTSPVVMVGREVLARVTPGQAGRSGARGQRAHPHWFLCSVRKTDQVICIDFCSREENARPPPPSRESQGGSLSWAGSVFSIF